MASVGAAEEQGDLTAVGLESDLTAEKPRAGSIRTKTWPTKEPGAWTKYRDPRAESWRETRRQSQGDVLG